MRDVIVIGAGGGGAVAAKELAARGLDVLVLEAGRYRKEFVGRHTQESRSSLGAWTTVAEDLAKQVDAWTTANAAQVRARRTSR